MSESPVEEPPRSTHWLSAERALAWARSTADRQKMMAAATSLMLDLAGVRAGMRVLDVAAGMGDQSILAAQRVGPSGRVLATDLSPVMLQGAQRKVDEIGLSNLECRVLDAQDVGTLGVDLFDAAICRNGLMFPPDLHRVLSGIFRVLKPGAKLGVVVWSDASANPYQEIPRQVLEGMGLQSGATRNQASRLGPPGALEAAFGRAGFVSVEKHCLPAPRHFASVAEAVARLEEMGGIADTLRQLSGTDRERVLAAIELELERFAGADGCDIPGESLVAGGVVPLPV